MTNGEWVIAITTLAGPILAVQAQKLVEAARAKRNLKENIFQTLMATRSVRLSAEHVRALNAIDIAFYGRRIFKVQFQSRGEKAVRRAWRDYFDSLSLDNSTYSADQNRHLIDLRYEKFIALLSAIAVEQRYDFDPIDLKKNVYNPVFHGEIEEQNRIVRQGIVNVLKGEIALKMEIVVPSAISSQRTGSPK
jgi:hypothetical protein